MLTADDLRAIEYCRRFQRRAENDRAMEQRLKGNDSAVQDLLEKTQGITNREVLYAKGQQIGCDRDYENNCERFGRRTTARNV
jgi:hypothetical protein